MQTSNVMVRVQMLGLTAMDARRVKDGLVRALGQVVVRVSGDMTERYTEAVMSVPEVPVSRLGTRSVDVVVGGSQLNMLCGTPSESQSVRWVFEIMDAPVDSVDLVRMSVAGPRQGPGKSVLAQSPKRVS